jgi:hypothetical protein
LLAYSIPQISSGILARSHSNNNSISSIWLTIPVDDRSRKVESSALAARSLRQNREEDKLDCNIWWCSSIGSFLSWMELLKKHIRRPGRERKSLGVWMCNRSCNPWLYVFWVDYMTSGAFHCLEYSPKSHYWKGRCCQIDANSVNFGGRCFLPLSLSVLEWW